MKTQSALKIGDKVRIHNDSHVGTIRVVEKFAVVVEDMNGRWFRLSGFSNGGLI